MSGLTEVSYFGIRLHPWTMEETVAEISRRLHAEEFTQHVVVNAAKIANMRSDTELRNSIASCDIVNIDGMGVVWGARFLGVRVPERVAGIDLFHRLLEMSAHEGLPVFFLGAHDDTVRTTASRVQIHYPNLKLAGYHHGYFMDDEESVVARIRNSGAKLLFVAISSPTKENFINRWREKLGVDFVMGVGGTFDVVAGKVKRAPIWMQNWGLEWLYRVLQEPKRMWKRYLFTNTQFLWMVLVERLKAKY